MMRHDNFYVAGGYGGKPKAKFPQLTAVDAAIFSGQSACGVHASHSHLFVNVPRLEILGDVLSEAIEHLKKARENVVQWHVVIAGDNELRKRNTIKEFPCGNELLGACALRKVAGNHNEIRPS